MKRFPTATLALLLVFGSLPAMAGPGGTRRSWDLTQYTWIKRVPAEKGAPANGHPLRVDVATLIQALDSVHVILRAKDQALFDPTETAALGRPLAEALSLAEPGEDLELVSTAKRGDGFFSMNLAVTAKVFIEGGRLNLIVRASDLDIMAMSYFAPPFPEIECGSRFKASAVVLKAAGAESRRRDWVILPLEPRAMAVAAPVVTAPVVTAPVVQAPVVTAQPVPPPQPPPAGSVEERLRTLKRLRDQNLITEEDYAKKKQELLKEI